MLPIADFISISEEIIEENDPETFFMSPANERKRAFLDQVLTRQQQ
jgi:hypothetical protein